MKNTQERGENIMSKILYAAGTFEHIKNFHLPYIDRLRRDGHEVTVMARGEGADLNIPFVKKMLSFKNIICSLRIRGIIKRGKFDTVVLNTTLAAFDTRLFLPKRNRPKVINFVHGYMFSPEPKSIKEKIFLFCEQLLSKKTDYIMVMNSEDCAIAEKYRLCISEIKMTRGMGARISESDFLPVELMYERRRNSDKYIISFVGELSAAKNQRMLICALPEIQVYIPNAVLWLVGDGGHKEALIRLTEKLNLSDSVRFWGYRPHPCDYIRASDLYISASKKEGLPFNVLEAVGCGKTVIASNVKGHRDIIENGKSGFLFSSGDLGELVRLVRGVYRGELSIKPTDARQRYKVFSFDSVFPETYGIMKELIDK